MSNYGNPNANKNGVQSSPASSGQSPYMGYQQNAYQTGPNQSAIRRIECRRLSGNQNSNRIRIRTRATVRTVSGAAETTAGIPRECSEPICTGRTQAPYQGQYGQGYVQNQTPGGQNVPNPGSGYAPYRTQQPYAAQPQGYAPRQTGPQPYAGMQSGPQPTYPGGQPGYAGPGPHAAGGMGTRAGCLSRARNVNAPYRARFRN